MNAYAYQKFCCSHNHRLLQPNIAEPQANLKYNIVEKSKTVTRFSLHSLVFGLHSVINEVKYRVY